MFGGSDEAYERLGAGPRPRSPRRSTASPCCAHVGPDAAGHFVKMVHNGIEYADMQLIAEAYDLLRTVLGPRPRRDRRDLPRLERGRPRVVPDRDHRRRPRPRGRRDRQDRSSTSSRDAAEQKGTGRWTVQSALDLGVPVTGIAEATFARSLSGHIEQRDGRPGGLRVGDRGRHPPRTPTPSSTTSGPRCTPPRSSPTPRGSTRSAPAATRTTGTSTSARWRRSGAAAASSGPGSSTGSARPTTDSPDLPTLLADRTSPTP